MIKINELALSESLAAADIELSLLGGQMRTLDGPWRRLRRVVSELAYMLPEREPDSVSRAVYPSSVPIEPSRTIGFSR